MDALAAGTDDPLAKASAERGIASGLQTQRGAEMKSGIAGLEAGQKDLDTFRGQRPTPQAQPTAPKSTMGDDAAAWITVATMMGAIGSAATRGHTTASLAAFTGTLEGAKEGNREKFEQSAKAWEMASKEVTKSNQQALDAYGSILDDKKQSMQEKLLAVQLKARELQDEVTYHLAASGDYMSLAQLHDKRAETQKKWDESHDKIKRDEEKERLRGQTARDVATIRANSRGAGMNDDAINNAVEAHLAGRPDAIRGIPAGSPDMEKFKNRLAEVQKERGVSASDVGSKQQEFAGETAATRSVATRVKNLETVIASTKLTIPLALAASEKVNRSDIVPFNQAMQAIQARGASPELKDFVGKNMQLAELWARAMKGPGVLDVALQEKAFNYLATAESKGNYRAAVKSIYESMQTEEKAQKSILNKAEPSLPPDFGPPAKSGAAKPAADGWKIEEVK